MKTYIFKFFPTLTLSTLLFILTINPLLASSGVDSSRERPANNPEVLSKLVERSRNHDIQVIVQYGTYLDKSYRTQSKLLDEKLDLQRKGISIVRDLSPYNAVVVTVSESQLRELISNPNVISIEEDIALYLHLDDSIPQVNADIIHSHGNTGQNVSVAVLDTGIDTNHPFFQNRIIAEACFSTTTEIRGGLCPNGEDQQFGAGAGRDCFGEINHPDCHHGTHVAGIAAGHRNQINPETGVASGANIVSVQVFSERLNCENPNNCRLNAQTSDVLDALHWINQNSANLNIASVNMSFGSGEHTVACNSGALVQVANALRNSGVALVASSGNEGYTNAIEWPACISSVVAVGSTETLTDTVSGFSNRSNLVDILAPGQIIRSSIAGGVYGNMQGTSMSAPHVAGAFALLRNRQPKANYYQPTAFTLLDELTNNGTSIYDSESGLTFPRLNLNFPYAFPTHPQIPVHTGDIFLHGEYDSPFIISSLSSITFTHPELPYWDEEVGIKIYRVNQSGSNTLLKEDHFTETFSYTFSPGTYEVVAYRCDYYMHSGYYCHQPIGYVDLEVIDDQPENPTIDLNSSTSTYTIYANVPTTIEHQEPPNWDQVVKVDIYRHTGSSSNLVNTQYSSGSITYTFSPGSYSISATLCDDDQYWGYQCFQHLGGASVEAN